MKIAHVSDLHFGAELPEVVEALAVRLQALKPDLVVASGDFTMAARHREFVDARGFLESLPAPIVATPGNHDMPVRNLVERFTNPFKRYRRYITPITENQYACDSAAVITANSARPWDLSFNWSHGRLSDQQVDCVDDFFSEHDHAPFKALVVHHPFCVPEDLPGFRTIRNGGAMLDVLARHRADAVLAGHLHRQFTATRVLPLGEGASHELALLQVATATSSRHREQPNAFAVIQADPDGVTVIPQVWDGREFAPQTERKQA